MAVLVPFPFSDLSQAKLRPAVALADVGRGDWILCQSTSNPYGDPHAVRLEDASFAVGALHVVSYARPGKLFTAHYSLMVTQVGILKAAPLQQIIEAGCCAPSQQPQTLGTSTPAVMAQQSLTMCITLGTSSSPSPLADPAPNQALVALR
jgi:hypothetical protein